MFFACVALLPHLFSTWHTPLASASRRDDKSQSESRTCDLSNFELATPRISNLRPLDLFLFLQVSAVNPLDSNGAVECYWQLGADGGAGVPIASRLALLEHLMFEPLFDELRNPRPLSPPHPPPTPSPSPTYPLPIPYLPPSLPPPPYPPPSPPPTPPPPTPLPLLTPLFDELRTKQQRGYSVGSLPPLIPP